MKKKALIFVLVVSCTLAVMSAPFDQTTFPAAFKSFSESMSTALPFNSAIGLSWSDAYIGNLLGIPPHFGVGIATGAVLVPIDGVKDMLDGLGVAVPSVITGMNLGLPLPAAVVEGRIGGFILPFDIGLKGMMLTKDMTKPIAGVGIEFLNVGADVRYALVKQNLLLPNVSVGIGYNYLKGEAAIPTNVEGITLTLPDGTGPASTLTFAPGDVGLRWSSQVIEAKAQVSKSLIIFTPYLGGAVSMSWSSIGGGLSTKVSIDGTEPTQAQIDAIVNQLKAAGKDVPEISKDGIWYTFPSNAFSLRLFGGFSVNILLLKLDLTAHYNINAGAFGASLGARIQL